MKKLSDKSTGVLIFAFNNQGLDYLKLAIACATRVINVWKLPVTIVTDTPFEHERISCLTCNTQPHSSSRYYQDLNAWHSFFNGNRYEAFALTPYDRTILIDSDFLVSTTNVLDVWDGTGVRLSKTPISLTDSELPSDLTSLGSDGLPLFLATIVCFDKSKTSQAFFSYWMKARRWYRAYANFYGFNHSVFRNDFCVTIALDLLKQKIGSTDPFTLHYEIPTAGFDMEVTSLKPLRFRVEGTELEFQETDVHILSKRPLLELIDSAEDNSCYSIHRMEA